MSDETNPTSGRAPWDHSDAFRRRRALNWVPLGISYALLYTGRYNFSVANLSIACERHWEIERVSLVIAVGLAVYGISTFVNGPIADKIGGRRAILIGTLGAGLANLAFPAAVASGAIPLLLVVWALNSYFQSFGALSVVKVNAAWFHVRERGAFSGIFGTMIQSGRWLILALGGYVLAAIGWRSLYFGPGVLLLVAFAANYLLVQDSPERAGHAALDTGDETAKERETPATLGFVVRKIFTSRVAWLIAAANFCTGFVRLGIEQYWRLFFGSVYHLDTKSLPYQLVANVGFVAGVLGSMTAGIVSDRFFGSRRGPVASIWYMGQAAILLGFATVVPAIPAVLSHGAHHANCAVHTDSSGGAVIATMLAVTAGLVAVNFVVANTKTDTKLWFFGVQVVGILLLGIFWRSLGRMFADTAPAAVATVMIVLLQFFIGGAHGLLAGTASMDYGGKRAAATAAGFFDGVQYLAGAVAGTMFGAVLAAHGWSWWIPSITPFAAMGAVLMALLWKSMPASAARAH